MEFAGEHSNLPLHLHVTVLRVLTAALFAGGSAFSENKTFKFEVFSVSLYHISLTF